MEELATTIYHLEQLHDGLGEGFRVYTSHDQIYEARSREDEIASIHTANGQWHVQTRHDTVDHEEYHQACNAIEPTRERLQTLEDHMHLPMINDFYDEIREGGYQVSSADNTTNIQYNLSDRFLLSRAGLPTSDEETLWNRATIGGAAGVASTLGLSLTGIGALPLAFLAGSSAATTLGGITGLHFAQMDRDYIFTQPDQINDQNYLTEAFKELNEHTGEKSGPLDFDDRSQAEALWNQVKDVYFESFDDREGLIIQREEDTYQDAIKTVTTLFDQEQPNLRAPSIYTAPPAFKHIFDKLPETDRRALIRNAMHHGTDQEIAQYLEEEQKDLLNESARSKWGES